ncbi:snurportin-1 [Nematostella vectensis]|uniref:snurportin-1 n=1 Tax=Nematostella vectensis TaxID=45351 RepID=UPI0020774340|nr:snurportin-1 [Nematostella vectensis]
MADELVNVFAGSFAVSSDANDTAAPHPRIGDYKVKPHNVPDQHVRRERKLEQQKKKRMDFVNYSRKLVDGCLDEDDLQELGHEEMDTISAEDKKSRRKKFNPYAYQLMLSEWLVDVPDDLTQEWLMVQCPFGKRNLIIAVNGATSAYTKSGFRVNRFTSLLPGGSPQTLKPNEYSILDCIFCEITSTFYILDIMCWRGHPVFDTETEFRFYWLKTKLQELSALGQATASNPYKFISLEYCPCTAEAISHAVSTPTPFQVDGLLFFHKRTHYSQGRTPLVGWLKPYMLPEILGIPVSPEIIASAPSVNKLTLLKANKDLEDTTDDKTLEEREHAALLKSEKNALMKMETEGKKDRKSKGFKQVEQNGNGIMEGGLEMEIDQSSGRRRKNRRKKKLGDMEVEVPDEAPGEEKIADMA